MKMFSISPQHKQHEQGYAKDVQAQERTGHNQIQIVGRFVTSDGKISHQDSTINAIDVFASKDRKNGCRQPRVQKQNP